MERGSWVGVAGVLASALVIGWTAAENWLDARRVLGAAVSYGLLLVLVACAVAAAAAVVRAASLLRDPAGSAHPGAAGRARTGWGILLLVAALLFVVVFRQVLGIAQRPSWPPPANAVTSAGAEAATEEFAARDGTRPHDADLDFAWSTAATIEPLVEGRVFFPRIFADVEAARSSVHILMFGWREGEVGTEMAALLEGKLAAGVEVRVIVDAYGSRPNGEAREMFTRLAEAGAQIVVNDVLPLDRDGLYPDDRHLDWRQDEVGRADHPYLTDRDMLERILAAARRGVRVRLVVSETSNNAQATAALRHRYDDLLAAGVEIWDLPGTVVHAKVVVADDVVSFGTVNLDSWALYRNSEIAMIAQSAEAAAQFEARLFEPDIARAHAGEAPSGLGERLESWLWEKLAYFL